MNITTNTTNDNDDDNNNNILWGHCYTYSFHLTLF